MYNILLLILKPVTELLVLRVDLLGILLNIKINANLYIPTRLFNVGFTPKC
ncbi:uncharacterized protein RAG0_17785 [Rhynchosporium agropyri]|uniref:Uncharacterized protein n=1 Tax=Rhynchosporium agropyri TaxID=914238 RepID=A0A1E1LU17_9HELO|nr:uncharacterized protein RAG0_17785 [Rhynchosporium agropyri]